MLSTSLKTAMAETTIGLLTVNSIAINSIKCFETRDTCEKLTLNCGFTTALCHSALARCVRVRVGVRVWVMVRVRVRVRVSVVLWSQ